MLLNSYNQVSKCSWQMLPYLPFAWSLWLNWWYSGSDTILFHATKTLLWKTALVSPHLGRKCYFNVDSAYKWFDQLFDLNGKFLAGIATALFLLLITDDLHSIVSLLTSPSGSQRWLIWFRLLPSRRGLAAVDSIRVIWNQGLDDWIIQMIDAGPTLFIIPIGKVSNRRLLTPSIHLANLFIYQLACLTLIGG